MREHREHEGLDWVRVRKCQVRAETDTAARGFEIGDKGIWRWVGTLKH